MKSAITAPQLFKTWWQRLKLTLGLMGFFLQLTIVRFIDLARQYKLLTALYIFVLIQVLLLVTPLELERDEPELISLSSWNQVVAGRLLIDSNVPTFTIPAKKSVVESQLKTVQQTLEVSPSMNLELNYTNRDLLINQALLELALNNQQAFEESILYAKAADPNWDGWANE